MTSFIRDFKIYPDAAIDENVTLKYHELCSVVSLSQLFHRTMWGKQVSSN